MRRGERGRGRLIVPLSALRPALRRFATRAGGRAVCRAPVFPRGEATITIADSNYFLNRFLSDVSFSTVHFDASPSTMSRPPSALFPHALATREGLRLRPSGATEATRNPRRTNRPLAPPGTKWTFTTETTEKNFM
jgi:hypothetical protein